MNQSELETIESHPVASSTQPTKSYDNNPFMITVRGIERLFEYAKPIAITILVISGLLGLANAVSVFIPTPEEDMSTEAAAENYFGENGMLDASLLGTVGLIVLIVTIGLLLIGLVISGIADYSAAAAANNRKATLSEALDNVFKHFWPYLILRVLIFVKLMLWSLLFIVPGIYFNFRYALSGVVFFSENKRGNAAIKRSLALTKNAWLTTVASYHLLNLLSLYLLQFFNDTAASSELYRNFRSAVDSGQGHPKPHVLSWVYIALIALLTLLVLALLALIVVYAASFIVDMSSNPGLQTQSL